MYAMRGERRERGFTMIEVMVALLLTAIAAMGLLALYMSQTRASSYSRHATEAAALATDKLEKLRTMQTASSGTDTVDEQGGAGGIFTRTWTVTSGTDYDDITVVVQWDDEGSRTVQVYGRRAK